MESDSEHKDPVKKPVDRDKALSVAYLRLIGQTQEQVEKAAGVSARTIYNWERCSWWPEMEAEASRRWLKGLEATARATLQADMDGNLALKVLERRLPELAPPTQKAEHQFPEELKIRVVYDEDG